MEIILYLEKNYTLFGNLAVATLASLSVPHFSCEWWLCLCLYRPLEVDGCFKE